MNLQPVKGTRDLFGPEWAKFTWINSQFAKIGELYGFETMELPIFESTRVFARTLGEESDIVSKEMYTFVDKGGDSLTLRPEGTASLVRALISNSLTQVLPQKWLYSGPMFRHERPQKGRYRQFYQIGAELVGVDSPSADVEVLSMAWQFLNSIGLEGKVSLELNSIGNLESRKKYLEELHRYFESHMTALSPESQARLRKNPLRILDSKQKEDQALLEGAPLLEDFLDEASKLHFEQVVTGLKSLGLSFQVNPRLVRGLDYYCHTVFEFTTTLLGAQNAVLSGGRYDGLVKAMGGPEAAGTGWAAGVDRLAELVTFAPMGPRPVACIAFSSEDEAQALVLTQELRHKGVKTELITGGGNLGKKFKRADRFKSHTAVMVGGEEWKRGELIVKNLDSGEQQTLPKAQLLPYLEARKK